MAHANRSLCFKQLGLYKAALQDIELALKGDYPEHLVPDLKQHKANCIQLIQNEVEQAKVETGKQLELQQIYLEVREIVACNTFCIITNMF